MKHEEYVEQIAMNTIKMIYNTVPTGNVDFVKLLHGIIMGYLSVVQTESPQILGSTKKLSHEDVVILSRKTVNYLSDRLSELGIFTPVTENERTNE